MPRASGRQHLVFGSQLSPRELDCIRLAAEGLTNKEIGHRLDPPLTDSTVKNHFNAAFIKLGANDRAHVVALGIREGLIDVGESIHPAPPHLTPDELIIVREMISSWGGHKEILDRLRSYFGHGFVVTVLEEDPEEEPPGEHPD